MSEGTFIFCTYKLEQWIDISTDRQDEKKKSIKKDVYKEK